MRNVFIVLAVFLLSFVFAGISFAGLDSYGPVSRDVVGSAALQPDATGAVAAVTGAVTRVNAYKQKGSYTIVLRAGEASDGGTNFAYTAKLQKLNASTWTDVSGATATLTGTNLVATATGALDWAGLQSGTNAVTHLRVHYVCVGAMVATNPVNAVAHFVIIDGYK